MKNCGDEYRAYARYGWDSKTLSIFSSSELWRVMRKYARCTETVSFEKRNRGPTVSASSFEIGLNFSLISQYVLKAEFVKIG